MRAGGIGQGLLGLLLTYNEGVAYGQAGAVDGWRITEVLGDPEATLSSRGRDRRGRGLRRAVSVPHVTR